MLRFRAVDGTCVQLERMELPGSSIANYCIGTRRVYPAAVAAVIVVRCVIDTLPVTLNLAQSTSKTVYILHARTSRVIDTSSRPGRHFRNCRSSCCQM